MSFPAGIAWIGASFYFIRLDLGLAPPKEPKEGVAGEYWGVHGGGFYHSQKYKVAPPRLPEQPIFYPVLSEDYAVKIARDWNVPASGAGFVTRFEVLKSFLDSYHAQEAGGRAHREYWIPAEELEAFNAAIVGPIEVVREFR